MNPVYKLGDNAELDNSLALLKPSELKKKAYNYYFIKLYALITNLFKWEIKGKTTFYPTRYIEIILNTKGAIMYGEAFIGRGQKKQSIGNVFASYVSMTNQLDFFGQETKVRMQPYYNTALTLSTQYMVANSLPLSLDIREDSKLQKCVLGFNTQLRESIEWLPFLCAKLALLDSAEITNINLLKQPLTMVVDERSEFSGDELIEDYYEGMNIFKLFSAAGKSLMDSLVVHSTGAENYIDTYEQVKQQILKEAYERMGISTNVVDKKERVLQIEQVTQNSVSNLVYAEKWQQRQKLIADIERIFPEMKGKITCTPVLSLDDSKIEGSSEQKETEEGDDENE